MEVQGAYVYEGITVELYDLWFEQGPFQDQAFYEYHIKQQGGKALEIGSGTGRLLLPYLRNGLDVEGVEPSAEMVSLCSEKAEAWDLNPVVYQQFMQRLNVTASYRTIFVPLCTFQLL